MTCAAALEARTAVMSVCLVTLSQLNPTIPDLSAVTNALHEIPALDAVHVQFPEYPQAPGVFSLEIRHVERDFARQACEVIRRTLRELGYSVSAW